MHSPASPDLGTLLEALLPAVREAGRFIEAVKAKGVIEQVKADDSPVTEADRGAEDILRAAILAVDPDAVIVGEEGVADGDIPAPTARFWLLDPLDGTRDFVAGREAYTVNAGLVVDGAPALGLVLHPPTGKLWAGGPGLGAWVEPRDGPRAAIASRPLARPPVLMLSHSHLDPETQAWSDAVPGAIAQSAGSSIKFCRLAAGAADAYPRFGPTSEWDTAAADAVLRGAGGTTLAAGGEPFRYGKPGYRNGPFLALGDPAAATLLPRF
ncbi:MAG: 3'(2'),5'-bisphosphate nucleotidase CysQ [Thermaurantiacus sp.]